MNGQARRLETEEQRERFHQARRVGGMCAACGRSLGPGEPVYIEGFTDYGGIVKGPVGAECAAEGFLADTRDQEPEQCVGCNRPMHYRVTDARRKQAVCSVRCRGRAAVARHRQAARSREA